MAQRVKTIFYKPCQHTVRDKHTGKWGSCGELMGRMMPCGVWVCEWCWLDHWVECDVCYEKEQEIKEQAGASAV